MNQSTRPNSFSLEIVPLERTFNKKISLSLHEIILTVISIGIIIITWITFWNDPKYFEESPVSYNAIIQSNMLFAFYLGTFVPFLLQIVALYLQFCSLENEIENEAKSLIYLANLLRYFSLLLSLFLLLNVKNCIGESNEKIKIDDSVLIYSFVSIIILSLVGVVAYLSKHLQLRR